MTEYIIKNGCVVDPTQNINAQKMDICIKDGKFVDKVSNAAKVIDASGKLVMAAGVDIHSHVAGPKVDMGRLFRPEDKLALRCVARTPEWRWVSLFRVPQRPDMTMHVLVSPS